MGRRRAGGSGESRPGRPGRIRKMVSNKWCAGGCSWYPYFVGGERQTSRTDPDGECIDTMAKTAVKEPAKKVVVLESVEAGLTELITDGIVSADIKALIEAGIVSAELDTVDVEAGKFSGDYVRFSVGEKATTDEDVVKALVAIAGGNLTSPAKTDGEGVDERKPSLVKFALYGADLNARSRTSQRVKAAAEGPEKNIEKMADIIQKSKPGKFTREAALEMARMMLGDDDEAESTDEAATETAGQ